MESMLTRPLFRSKAAVHPKELGLVPRNGSICLFLANASSHSLGVHMVFLASRRSAV
jgi:hypothetical protein